MSSGFLESLGAYCQCSISGKPGGPAEGRDGGDKTYTSLSPELGLMCLRMDPTRSVAMISVFAGYRVPSENQTKMKIGYGKRRVKMNSKREGKRRCATGKSGGSPSPINTERPPQAQCGEAARWCLQIERRQLAAGWRATASQLYFGSGGPATFGPRHREEESVGKKGASPALWRPLCGALLGATE